MTVYNIKTDFGAVGDGVADDMSAFVNAGNAMAADPNSDLVLPAGTYLFNSNPVISGRTGQFWAKGVQGRVLGAGIGTTILNLNGHALGTGAIGVYHDGNHFASIQTVSAGSTTLQLITPAQYTIFPVGRWVLVCGLNQQDIYSDVPNTGYGYPPNFAYCEYAQIQSITSGGLVTLSVPLQQGYKATWPHINDGNAFETTAAGQAGIHLLDAEWAADIEVRDLTVTSNGNQLYAGCHSATFTNVDFPSSSAVIPSQNKYFVFDNVTTNVDTEVDKLVENFTVRNSNVYRLSFQSATMNNFTVDNSNIGLTADLVTTATTSIGSNTITVSSVPSWLINGTGLLYTSVLGQFGSVSVSGTTSTTMTLSGSALKAVNIGDKFGFIRGGLNGAGIQSTITNSKLSICQPGAYAYGVCPNPFTISNCEVWNWNLGGFTDFLESNGTMSGGVIALPNGTSVSNITNNGSGKARYTVTNSGGLTAGKIIPTGNIYQQLNSTASATSGTNTVTFGGGVPAWIVNGVVCVSNSYLPTSTTVTSTTATTVTFNKNLFATAPSGSAFAFRNDNLSTTQFSAGGGATILNVVDGTTVDFDQTFQPSFTYSYGASINTGGAYRWARPNTYLYWKGTLPYEGAFKVIDVTQDAVKTYVQTNLPGGFPTLPKSTFLQVQTPGAQQVRASSLTGPASMNTALIDSRAYNKPLASFSTLTYTGSDSAILQRSMPTIFGKLSKITINVSQIYTGTLFANLFLQFVQFPNLKFVVDGVSTDAPVWGINLKQAGTRIILPTNISTNATQKTGDSSLIVPSWSNELLLSGTPSLNFQTSAGTNGTLRDISSEASNLWPIVTVEVETDQGFQFVPSAVAPLRLRLRA